MPTACMNNAKSPIKTIKYQPSNIRSFISIFTMIAEANSNIQKITADTAKAKYSETMIIPVIQKILLSDFLVIELQSSRDTNN